MHDAGGSIPVLHLSPIKGLQEGPGWGQAGGSTGRVEDGEGINLLHLSSACWSRRWPPLPNQGLCSKSPLYLIINDNNGGWLAGCHLEPCHACPPASGGPARGWVIRGAGAEARGRPGRGHRLGMAPRTRRAHPGCVCCRGRLHKAPLFDWR